MNTRRLRAALHDAVDLVLDALEEAPAAAERPVRRTRRVVPPPIPDVVVPAHVEAKARASLRANGYDLVGDKT